MGPPTWRQVFPRLGANPAGSTESTLIQPDWFQLDAVRNESDFRGLNVFRGVPFVSWERPFDQPVPLPSGPPARTLRDAANFIRQLPKAERETAEWRLAIQMLIDASEGCGPMLFAKLGIERAAYRNLAGTFNPTNEPHRRRRKLARNR